MNQERTETIPFRPKARLLRLLGDELIRDPNIAIFELVKNSYDADATYAQVSMLHVSDPNTGRIVVEDDGTGMDWETITKVWMEPGTDFRLRQRGTNAARSSKYRRLPLGEKGVGRFSSGKLGDAITLVTRAQDQPEIVLHIDWEQLLESDYLSDALVQIQSREPLVFLEGATGTKIEMSSLRAVWNRGMVREAHRAIGSICSPFGGPEDFKPVLKLNTEHHGWLDGLIDPETVIEQAIFRASGTITGVESEGDFLSYEYEFSPPPGMDRVEGRRFEETNWPIPVPRALWSSAGWKPSLADHAIGDISFKLHIFDLEPQILHLTTSDRGGLRRYLRQNGGIRVYRDGVRVYNYGEPGEDWLDLGGRRVNSPAGRLSNNLVIGAFSLDLEKSPGLIEKTNREGFVENPAYQSFKNAVMTTVGRVTFHRNEDKLRIRNSYGKRRERFVEALENLRTVLDQRGLLEEFSTYLDQVEREHLEFRDRLMTSAGAGLSLATVIHEVEKGIQELNRAVERDVSVDRLRELATHLSELVDGLTYLTRRSGRSVENASTLARQSLFNTEYRMRYHSIVANNTFSSEKDFRVQCSRRLIVATLMNLIDNSIFWLDQKGSKDKVVYMGPSRAFRDGPAIIVGDNGPGFRDPPELLAEPFISNKPDGMGLGLHIASEVMKAHDGRLHFPEQGEVDLPPDVTGAVVALIFKGEE